MALATTLSVAGRLPVAETKACPSCNRGLPLSAFGKDASRADGHHQSMSRCACINLKHASRRCSNAVTYDCRICGLLCSFCLKKHHAPNHDAQKIKGAAILSRLFKIEVINGGERCPTYLYRWELLRRESWAIYLHHFVGDDWSRDLHDHPKRFISIGLVGRYVEETPKGERVYRAPWIRTFPATHVHRLRLINKRPCWTIVTVLKTVREWGFWHSGRWIEWREYVFGSKASLADSMKSCPD